MGKIKVKSMYVVVLGLICSVLATPMDHLTEDFTSILVGCLDENPVEVKELEMLTNKIMPDSEVARCLFACAYKKAGTMDDAGKLNTEGLRNLTSLYFPDDAEKMKTTEVFIKTCLKVNDETVSDGNKGCDRAGLLFKCSVENFSDFDLV